MFIESFVRVVEIGSTIFEQLEVLLLIFYSSFSVVLCLIKRKGKRREIEFDWLR
jgi:hypothetical protein